MRVASSTFCACVFACSIPLQPSVCGGQVLCGASSGLAYTEDGARTGWIDDALNLRAAAHSGAQQAREQAASAGAGLCFAPVLRDLLRRRMGEPGFQGTQLFSLPMQCILDGRFALYLCLHTRVACSSFHEHLGKAARTERRIAELIYLNTTCKTWTRTKQGKGADSDCQRTPPAEDYKLLAVLLCLVAKNSFSTLEQRGGN